MIKSKGYAGFDSQSPLKPYSFTRREVGRHDVLIKITYCGICHSDIHTVRDEWGGAIYPLVPGHEIIGEVTKVGDSVKNHKIGDLVGVGCMVNSCGHCSACSDDLEQFCSEGATFTYNSEEDDGNITKGGYSDSIVVNEDFVLKAPTNLPVETLAPLLCAGITTYSPLKLWNVGPGDRVAVIGLGGLGHMGVKIAKALGAEVIVVTTSPRKQEDALRLGADKVIISTDPESMQTVSNSCDFALSTIAAPHNISLYTELLKPQKTLCLVGIPDSPHQISPNDLIFGRKVVTGSLIGGVAETQEVLDFCAEKQITADVELISIHDINQAYTRVIKGDVRYRFVIDMQTIND